MSGRTILKTLDFEKAYIATVAFSFLFYTAAPHSYAGATNLQVEYRKVQVLIRQNHISEARKRLQYLCQFPDASADMYCSLATTYLDMEGTEDDSKGCLNAISNMQIAIRKQPEYGRSYNVLASFANLKGNYSDAIKYATKALTVAEPYDEGLRQRALAYSHFGRYDEAIRDVEAFIKNNHAFSINYMLLGDLQKAAKHLDAAENSYRMSLKVATTYQSRSFNQLINCLKLQGKNDAAISEISTQIAKEPTNVEFYDSRGQLYLKTKKYKEAVADYTRAINMAPLSMYFTHRAAAYDALGQKQLADDDRVKAKKKGVPDEFIGF